MLKHISLNPQCCQNCRAPPNHDFKPVVNLKNSGLIIYIHENSFSTSRKMKSSDNYNKGSIILCNTGNKELQRYDYIVELCQYITKCYKCKILIQRIRDLIDNVNTVKGDEIIGICDHCKISKKKIECRRCEDVVNKFIKNEVNRYMEREHEYLEKLDKTRRILLSIMQGHTVCKHNIYLDSESIIHLDNLFKNLNTNVSSKQSVIDNFPEKNVRNDLGLEKSQILSKVISKLSIKTRKDAILESSSSDSNVGCICKYLMNHKQLAFSEEENKKGTPYLINIIPGSMNKIKCDTSSTEIAKQKPIISVPPVTPQSKISTVKNDGVSKSKLNDDDINLSTKDTKQKSILRYSRQSPLKEIVTTNYDISKTKIRKGIHYLNEKNISQRIKSLKDISHKDISKEPQANFDNNVMLKLVKQRKKNRTNLIKKIEKENVTKVFSEIEHLPIIRSSRKSIDSEVDKSESIVECKENHRTHIDRMIKGCNIVPCVPLYNREETIKLPLMFKIQTDCTEPPINAEELCSKPYTESKIKKTRPKINGSTDNSGIILYKLSNTEFIEKGWTKLPIIKLMRRVNIYKMMPCSKFDWFEHHKMKTLFYDSQEKLAEVYENGCGKWFYKNGNFALEYYSDEEFNTQKRCVIYSSGEGLGADKKAPVNVLACFSHLGHGIVYDNYGNIRLKYNQTEGLVIDKKISPPSRWKWHMLNDPPVLHPVLINTSEKDNRSFYNHFNNTENMRKMDDKMVAIELQNSLRNKTIKLQQEFKPFQIKMKTVKINDYFSLRIIDQVNIYIQFRCGRICHRFNIGMLLKHDEIIGTEAAEVTDVATPYDLSRLN